MHTESGTSERIPAYIDPWLTLRQGAAHAQADEATLRREIRRGRLRAARIGGRKCIRLRRSWIDQWLEQTSTPVEAVRS
jgi:excisionase family DNA binding protein